VIHTIHVINSSKPISISATVLIKGSVLIVDQGIKAKEAVFSTLDLQPRRHDYKIMFCSYI
jgi:hypothetical protein